MNSSSFERVVVGILFAALLVCTVPSTAYGLEDGPYCGIYSVFAGAVLMDCANDTGIDDLLTKEFVSKNEGSTATDLVAAAKVLGLDAKIRYHGTMATLLNPRTPLVLHISSPGQLKLFNHWLLLVEVNGSNARVIDGDDGKICTIPLSNLLLKWDGVMIELQSPSAKVGNHYQYVFLCSLTLVFVALLLCVRKISASFIKSEFVVASIAFQLSLGTLTVAYCTSAFGISSAESRFLLQLEGAAINLDEWVLAETDVSDSKIGFVDARYRTDYERSHIPTAVSIPVDCSNAFLMREGTPLKKYQAVVVYCQSEACGFDEIVARRLFRMGIKKVFVCKDGYAEWRKSKR